MFDNGGAPVAGLSTSDLAAFRRRLATLSTDVSDPERIDRIGELEALKSAASAAQVRMTAAFADSQCDQQRAAGVPEARVGQGIAAQVGLARREAPAKAAKHTGWAKVLVGELPNTFAALARGEISAWRAMIVARETIWLTAEDRATVDAELAGRLTGWGDQRVEAEAKRIGYRLDPNRFVARARAAERDRRVSLRPAPDTMARLTALLPVAQGVAAYAALAQAADTARTGGDQRGRGQVMADTLVQRVTGQTTADAVPVEINLVMTDHTLHGGASSAPGSQTPVPGSVDNHANEPAHLVGYGPVPAGIARDLALATEDTKVWVRRLYTSPANGQLVAMDQRPRRFNGRLRQALIIRDQTCRTPWCNAPIRHTDHAKPVADSGQTTIGNGQGLCEACNYAKQANGWKVSPGPGGTSQTVIIITPTEHTYTSRPPDLPGAPVRSRPGIGQRAGPADSAGG